MTTPNLGLATLVSAQSQPEVPVNASNLILDTLVQLAVKDSVNSPPGSPADGDRYRVTGSPTSFFAGHTDDIAYWVAGTVNVWRFITPKPGWICYDIAADAFKYFKSGGWVNLP